MPPNETERTIVMRSGSTLIAPISWEQRLSDDYLEVISPEKDISVLFLERPATKNLQQMAIEAWKTIQPHFDLNSSQDSTLPSSDSWEETRHVVYETPASESRYMSATVRTYEGNAYICLVDGKIAGVSRRVGELRLLNESWMPLGCKEDSLNSASAKRWTDMDIQNFEQFIAHGMQTLDVPGLSIAIVQKDGQMLYKNAFGVKQVGSTEPVNVDTLFMIGSTTKALTTLSMASLVDRQQFNWDTPVTHMLPQFSIGSPSLTQQLTIRHTVSASTGMPGRDLEFLFKYRQVTPEERLLQMKDMKPTTGFGETFQYSNHLVMAGGYAAARTYASQGDLESAYALMMQELVFNPLQMKRTVLQARDAIRLGAALPHRTDFSRKRCNIPLHWEDAVYSVAPAGAIWSTVDDLARYLLVEMNTGSLDGVRIISEAAINERRQPGIKIGAKASYGLGLMIKNEQGLNIIGHDGGTLGFSSHVFFLPEKEIGVSILCNAQFAHDFLFAIGQKFLELTFSVRPCSDEKLHSAVLTREALIKKNQQQVLFNPVDMAFLESLKGDYACDSLGKLKLFKSTNGEGYEVEFEEWSSRIGVETEANGKKLLVLVDGPFPGMCKLLVTNHGTKLIIDVMQEHHEFIRLKMQHAYEAEPSRMDMPCS